MKTWVVQLLIALRLGASFAMLKRVIWRLSGDWWYLTCNCIVFHRITSKHVNCVQLSSRICRDHIRWSFQNKRQTFSKWGGNNVDNAWKVLVQRRANNRPYSGGGSVPIMPRFVGEQQERAASRRFDACARISRICVYFKISSFVMQRANFVSGLHYLTSVMHWIRGVAGHATDTSH